MKRKLAALAAAFAFAAALASCGEKEEVPEIVLADPAETSAPATTATTAEPTTKAALHERHDYEDGVLIGDWHGLFMDLTLKDDNTADADLDISDIFMIDTDGTVTYNDNEYPSESVSYDGSELTVNITPEGSDSSVELVKLVRTGEPDPDSFNGEYTMSEGAFCKIIYSALDVDENDPDLKILIDNSYFYIRTNNFCSYSQKADEITFSDLKFSTEMTGIELSDCTFVLDGDNFTLYDQYGVIDEFKRKNADTSEEGTSEDLSDLGGF